jgi:nucleoid-associated protein EbfC
MKGGFGNLMKQAQQVQAELQKAQEDLARMEVKGEAGGGMVQVVMTGRHDVRSVRIDPSLMQEDREMLEDLLAAAVNDAVRKVESTSQEKLSGLASGLNLPPGIKLPFGQ